MLSYIELDLECNTYLKVSNYHLGIEVFTLLLPDIIH